MIPKKVIIITAAVIVGGVGCLLYTNSKKKKATNKKSNSKNTSFDTDFNEVDDDDDMSLSLFDMMDAVDDQLTDIENGTKEVNENIGDYITEDGIIPNIGSDDEDDIDADELADYDEAEKPVYKSKTDSKANAEIKRLHALSSRLVSRCKHKDSIIEAVSNSYDIMLRETYKDTGKGMKIMNYLNPNEEPSLIDEESIKKLIAVQDTCKTADEDEIMTDIPEQNYFPEDLSDLIDELSGEILDPANLDNIFPEYTDDMDVVESLVAKLFSSLEMYYDAYTDHFEEGITIGYRMVDDFRNKINSLMFAKKSMKNKFNDTIEEILKYGANHLEGLKVEYIDDINTDDDDDDDESNDVDNNFVETLANKMRLEAMDSEDSEED